jgi:hypothetical protein
MADHALAAIEDYLARIHRDFFWPTILPPAKGKKAVAPDRLVQFQRVLMRTYVMAFRLQPPSCDSAGNCPDKLVCEDGLCICRTPDDCAQDELCIDGVCVSEPAAMTFASADKRPVYGEDLKTDLVAYNKRISGAMMKALAARPAHLSAARDILMKAYADSAKIAGKALRPCRNGQCADGEACVEGVCVPVPFRLVHRGRR